MRKLLCILGFHKMIWYSQYDKDLYWERAKKNKSLLVTGPLLECEFCDYHTRCEQTDGSKILIFKREK